MEYGTPFRRQSYRRSCRVNRRTKPGRPCALPGQRLALASSPNDSARFLLFWPAFDPNGRKHADINDAVWHPEPLPVHGHVLHPWLVRVLIHTIDHWNVADVLLDHSLRLLVEFQPRLGI